MKTPPLLLFGLLVLWGWQTEFLLVGVLIGALLESPHLIKSRWSFSQQDLDRIWDLCTVLFLAGLVVTLASSEGRGAMSGIFGDLSGRPAALSQASATMLRFVSWLPLVFLPIAVAQVFSVQERFEVSTFSWWLRKQRANKAEPRRAVSANVTYPYAAVCFLAVSATSQRHPALFVILCFLVAWGLWPQRRARGSKLGWLALMTLVAGLGFAGQMGLSRLQMWVEGLNVSWMQRFAGLGFNQKEQSTAIGQIGNLKLSGRIVLRIETDGQAPPELLREASYNAYRAPAWLNTSRATTPVPPENDNTQWQLLPEKRSRRAFRIAHYLRGGSGLLPLATGSSRIEQLAVSTMERTPLGVVRVTEGPGLASYVVRHDTGLTIDDPPVPEDKDIPPFEEPALSQIADELKLNSLPARQALEAIRRFFADRFTYSTFLTGQHRATSNQTALAAFLLKTRSGHCEYFATATTLLLRKAGIPARYAAGYSVQEGKGKRFVVRERHTHSWCLAYVDDIWQDVDNTPASWHAIEEGRASWWEGVSDAGSRLWFEFQKVRWGHTPARKYLVWVPLPLLLWLAARLYWNKGWKRFTVSGSDSLTSGARPGLDSEFFAIERVLRDRNLEREAGETLSIWLRRLQSGLADLGSEMPELLRLHYRYRFDPAGLSSAERELLRNKATAWMQRFRERQPRQFTSQI